MSAPVISPPKPVPLAPRFAAIALALRASRAWLMWRYELSDNRWTKPPRRVSDGGFPKTNDPTTWAEFEAARADVRAMVQRLSEAGWEGCK